jgi:hypothetical protein
MIVHTIMYSYYFVSLFIAENKLVLVKKSITIMQMVSSTAASAEAAAQHATHFN